MSNDTHTPLQAEKINEDLDFWTALEHDEWKLLSFSEKAATFQDTSEDTPKYVYVTFETMQFVSRGLHFMNDREQDKKEDGNGD